MPNIDTRDLVREYEGDLPRHTHKSVAIRKLLDDLRENCEEEPENGITMVPKDDFEEYAKEYADSCGYLQMKVVSYTDDWLHSSHVNEHKDAIDQWPFSHIDWKAAAAELATDWHEVEFRGVTYLAR